ncbi:hypothetical protein F1C58_10540 [Glaciihabitans sp. INWT7]|uniref:hypothetical protein n=1 Tax=Glaciihabitans sp. INWT7 TaxID=2596912 RepID=UPI0016260BC2|nr:hypothetical protein [Glaciihabitans sp. INWT7]QNE47288.1 hypothetical protein F1C58_10540 [Glaciihabitans sp. INWT7]
MKPSLAASILGTTVTAALLLGSCSAALASAPIGSAPTGSAPTGSVPAARSTGAPRTLSAVQALGAAATAARISALDRAVPRVTANTYLSATDKDQVLGTLNGDRAAMVTLAAKIAADTDLSVATADYHSIFTGYRVFAVAIPQSLYAAAASGLEDAAIPALQSAQATLAAAIAGPLASKDTPAIDATMADLAAQIRTAQQSVSGVSAFALSVTPAQFNGDHEILAATRVSVKTATAAAKKARADVASVKAALT